MFSHLNKNKQPKIVDISNKKITNRTAVAEGIVKFSKSTFKKLDSFTTKKGEINNIAILAGIMGAKKTSELIPLCHNINIENVDIKVYYLLWVYVLFHMYNFHQLKVRQKIYLNE